MAWRLLGNKINVSCVRVEICFAFISVHFARRVRAVKFVWKCKVMPICSLPVLA